MRNFVHRPQWMIVLTSVVVAGMSVASGETFPAFFTAQPPALAGQTLSASGVPVLHSIVDSGRNADLRWSDFTPYKLNGIENRNGRIAKSAGKRSVSCLASRRLAW
jgi:hypothetical protein